MDKKIYLKSEFDSIRERINDEIKRRGTYKWWDNLTSPQVGVDRLSVVDDKTFTINSPSSGSTEETGNIEYPARGNNPADNTTSSNMRFDVDEIRNYLVGLSKIADIDLFYARDEMENVAFRNPDDIENKLSMAEKDYISKQITTNTIKYDPNNTVQTGQSPTYGLYPEGHGVYVLLPSILPSGQYDGEEIKRGNDKPDESNFFDDYGALPGQTNHHPQNPYISEPYNVTHTNNTKNRNDNRVTVTDGNKSSIRFGLNPRNPNRGDQLTGRTVFGGVIGTCTVACFKAGTLIETEYGPKPIEEIQIGDNVLTKSRKYHRVYRTFKRSPNIRDLIIVRATGTPLIYTTDEHPFWVRRYIGFERVNGIQRQAYSEPEWVEAKDIKSRDKLCLLSHRIGSVSVDPDVAYELSMFTGEITRHYSEYDNDTVWASVTLTKKSTQQYDVYNISVENDPTYYADGVLVHNCSGACYLTCDNECTEHCKFSCWSRCGNACTSTCGNICTGCTTLCLNGCRTMCSGQNGLSCVNVGAETVTISSTGSAYGCSNNCGIQANDNTLSNNISYTTYKCNDCSYSCQFYPNKKTTCWDSACQSLCFTTCNSYCSASCLGGCINNGNQHISYKLGRGKGCMMGCTADCVGGCIGVCQGECINTCSQQCNELCHDDCSNDCSSNCGKCDIGCNTQCTGCDDNCMGSCQLLCQGTCSGCTSDCTSVCIMECNAQAGIGVI